MHRRSRARPAHEFTAHMGLDRAQLVPSGAQAFAAARCLARLADRERRLPEKAGGVMRRLVLLLALVIGWFSLTKGERKQLSSAGRDALAKGGRAS